MKAGRAWRIVAPLLTAGLVVGLVACGSRATPTSTRGPRLTATPCDKCGKDRSRPTPTPQQPVAVGRVAPEFELAGLAGEQVRLSDYRGQIVLLNFWATWCGPCRLEVPGLVSIFERYRRRGFTVVAVNLGEPSEQVQAYVDKAGMTFPVLLDPDGRTRRLYPSRGIPATVILDREGIVRHMVVGAMPEEMIGRLVEPLLGQESAAARALAALAP